MNEGSSVISGYLFRKNAEYESQIRYLEGHKLTEKDLTKKVFRIVQGCLPPEMSSGLLPVSNSQRGFQLASRTLYEIRPDGSFVIGGRLDDTKQDMEADRNDDNWITFDEAIAQLAERSLSR